MIAFLESDDFESAVRLAISIGRDSDTIASMSGAIAQAIYGGVPSYIVEICREKFSPELLPILDKFCDRYIRM